MGNFSDHINQSKSNLDFLDRINKDQEKRWDWQVTVCFYSALHLINAHVVSKTGKNYLTHGLTNSAINPYYRLSPAKFDEDTYKSYQKLLHLSRRSRYLLHENFKGGSSEQDVQPACLTFDKHFKKAIYHLDRIMDYMDQNYPVTFKKIKIDCQETKGRKFSNFIT